MTKKTQRQMKRMINHDEKNPKANEKNDQS